MEAFDLIIKNGTLVDGTSSPGKKADLAIRGDKIAFIGELKDRPKDLSLQISTIDASGCVVAPGFIDIHSHSDYLCFVAPKSESKVLDGVTMEVCGNCGSSPFPLSQQTRQRKQEGYSKYGLEIDWQDAPGFFRQVEASPSSINRAFLVGHGSIRDFIMGYDCRSPGPEELSRMREEVHLAMEAGALGLSSGLIYPPGCFSTTEELLALCQVVSQLGGIYTSHIRSEGDRLLEAIEEALYLARRAEVDVEISHIKTSGKRNWPKLGAVKDLLHTAIKEGLRVSCDRYPYVAAATDLNVILPHWAQEGGMEKELERLCDPATRKKLVEEILSNEKETDWDSIIISSVHSTDKAEVEGKSLVDLGKERGKPPVEAALDLLVEEKGRVWILLFSMCEENLEEILSWNFVSIGSDSSLRTSEGLLAQGKPHPRAFGTFSRALGRYSRERGILSLEKAVHRMTGMPAQKLGLDRRGLLKEGYFADITIFNPKRVIDRATYSEPHQYSEGIEYVVVNGVLTVNGGRHTGATKGRVIKK